MARSQMTNADVGRLVESIFKNAPVGSKPVDKDGLAYWIHDFQTNPNYTEESFRKAIEKGLEDDFNKKGFDETDSAVYDNFRGIAKDPVWSAIEGIRSELANLNLDDYVKKDGIPDFEDTDTQRSDLDIIDLIGEHGDKDTTLSKGYIDSLITNALKDYATSTDLTTASEDLQNKLDVLGLDKDSIDWSDIENAPSASAYVSTALKDKEFQKYYDTYLDKQLEAKGITGLTKAQKESLASISSVNLGNIRNEAQLKSLIESYVPGDTTRSNQDILKVVKDNLRDDDGKTIWDKFDALAGADKKNQIAWEEAISSGLSNNLDAVAEQVRGIKGKNTTDIAALKSSLETLDYTSEIDSLKSDLEQMGVSLKEINDNYKDAGNTDQIKNEAIKSLVNLTVEDKLKDIKSTDLTGIENAITMAEGELKRLTSEFAGLGTQTESGTIDLSVLEAKLSETFGADLTNLTKTSKTYESKIEGLQDQITNLLKPREFSPTINVTNETDQSALTESLKTLGATVSANQESVQKQLEGVDTKISGALGGYAKTADVANVIQKQIDAGKFASGTDVELQIQKALNGLNDKFTDLTKQITDGDVDPEKISLQAQKEFQETLTTQVKSLQDEFTKELKEGRYDPTGLQDKIKETSQNFNDLLEKRLGEAGIAFTTQLTTGLADVDKRLKAINYDTQIANLSTKIGELDFDAQLKEFEKEYTSDLDKRFANIESQFDTRFTTGSAGVDKQIEALGLDDKFNDIQRQLTEGVKGLTTTETELAGLAKTYEKELATITKQLSDQGDFYSQQLQTALGTKSDLKLSEVETAFAGKFGDIQETFDKQATETEAQKSALDTRFSDITKTFETEFGKLSTTQDAEAEALGTRIGDLQKTFDSRLGDITKLQTSQRVADLAKLSESIYSDISGLEGTLIEQQANQQESLEGLKGELTAAQKADLASLKGELTTEQVAGLAGLKGELTTQAALQEAGLAGLRGELTTQAGLQEAGLAGLKGELTAEQKAGLAGLRGELTTQAAKQEAGLTGLRGELTTQAALQEAGLAGLKGELTAEQKAGLTGLRGELTTQAAEQQAGLTGLRGELTTQAAQQQAGLAGLRGDLTIQQQEGLAGLRGDITTQQQTALSGLKGELTAQQQAGIAGTQADLANVRADLTGDIGNLGTSIAQQGQQFSDRLSSQAETQAQNLADVTSELRGDITANRQAADTRYNQMISDNQLRLAGIEQAFGRQIGDLSQTQARDFDTLRTTWGQQLADQESILQGRIDSQRDILNQRLSQIAGSQNYRMLSNNAPGVKMRRSKAYKSGRTSTGTRQLGRSMRIRSLNI